MIDAISSGAASAANSRTVSSDAGVFNESKSMPLIAVPSTAFNTAEPVLEL